MSKTIDLLTGKTYNIDDDFICIPQERYDNLLRAEIMLQTIIQAYPHNRESVIYAIKATLDELKKGESTEEGPKC